MQSGESAAFRHGTVVQCVSSSPSPDRVSFYIGSGPSMRDESREAPDHGFYRAVLPGTVSAVPLIHALDKVYSICSKRLVRLIYQHKTWES